MWQVSKYIANNSQHAADHNGKSMVNKTIVNLKYVPKNLNLSQGWRHCKQIVFFHLSFLKRIYGNLATPFYLLPFAITNLYLCIPNVVISRILQFRLVSYNYILINQ